MRVVRLGIQIGILALFVGNSAADTAVTACGQTHSGNVFLAADLDCSAAGGVAVTLTGSGRLDLAGFTLTGDSGVFLDDPKGSFKVVSSVPGGIVQGTGLPGHGIADVRFARLFVEGVTVAGFGDDGVKTEYITLDEAIVTGNAGHGARSIERLVVRSSEVSFNGGDGLFGNTSTKPLVRDSVITGNAGRGVYVARRSVKVERSTISDNGDHGIEMGSDGFSASVKDSTISGNGGDGIIYAGGRGKAAVLVRTDIAGNSANGVSRFEKVRLKDSSVVGNGGSGILQDAARPGKSVTTRLLRSTLTDNARFGVESDLSPPKNSRVAARDSTLTGNGTDAACGVTEACADIGSHNEPKLAGTSTCERSYQMGSGVPGTSWGVCTLD